MLDFLIEDFKTNRVRCIAECIGMLLALGVSVLLALTTPHPPMIIAYAGWLSSAILLGTCSWHRGSFGLMVTYGGFLIIDTYGLLRTLGLL